MRFFVLNHLITNTTTKREIIATATISAHIAPVTITAAIRSNKKPLTTPEIKDILL